MEIKDDIDRAAPVAIQEDGRDTIKSTRPSSKAVEMAVTLIRIPEAVQIGDDEIKVDADCRSTEKRKPVTFRGRSRRRDFPDPGPMPMPKTSELKVSVGLSGITETYPDLMLTYLIRADVKFHAREPKATVHALAESIVYSEGSRVIRYPGATVHGNCEDAAVDWSCVDLS
jgi:hypothetical protein